MIMPVHNEGGHLNKEPTALLLPSLLCTQLHSYYSETCHLPARKAWLDYRLWAVASYIRGVTALLR